MVLVFLCLVSDAVDTNLPPNFPDCTAVLSLHSLAGAGEPPLASMGCLLNPTELPPGPPSIVTHTVPLSRGTSLDSAPLLLSFLPQVHGAHLSQCPEER